LIAVYVDLIIASTDLNEIQRFKKHLNQAFEIKDLGEIKHCLGIEFSRNQDSIMLNQGSYIQRLIERFNMTDAKPVKTPMETGLKLTKGNETLRNKNNIPYRELLGCLMYLAVATRPDIAHAVSYLGQFNNDYGSAHWKTAKRILRYLKGSSDKMLVYQSTQENLKGYVDADWGSCITDRHSYTGCFFFQSRPNFIYLGNKDLLHCHLQRLSIWH